MAHHEVSQPTLPPSETSAAIADNKVSIKKAQRIRQFEQVPALFSPTRLACAEAMDQQKTPPSIRSLIPTSKGSPAEWDQYSPGVYSKRRASLETPLDHSVKENLGCHNGCSAQDYDPHSTDIKPRRSSSASTSIKQTLSTRNALIPVNLSMSAPRSSAGSSRVSNPRGSRLALKRNTATAAKEEGIVFSFPRYSNHTSSSLQRRDAVSPQSMTATPKQAPPSTAPAHAFRSPMKTPVSISRRSINKANPCPSASDNSCVENVRPQEDAVVESLHQSSAAIDNAITAVSTAPTLCGADCGVRGLQEELRGAQLHGSFKVDVVMLSRDEFMIKVEVFRARGVLPQHSYDHRADKPDIKMILFRPLEALMRLMPVQDQTAIVFNEAWAAGCLKWALSPSDPASTDKHERAESFLLGNSPDNHWPRLHPSDIT